MAGSEGPFSGLVGGATGGEVCPRAHRTAEWVTVKREASIKTRAMRDKESFT
jgi:hypothetical protein